MKDNNKPNVFKNLIFLITFLMSILYSNAKAGEITYKILFDTNSPDVEFIQSPSGDYYSQIIWEGLNSYGAPGTPELPYKMISFIVPTLSNNYRVNVIDFKEGNSLDLKYKIIPGQKSQTVSKYNKETFIEPDSKEYEHNSTTPKAQFVSHTFIDGDMHIVTIAVLPCAYNASINNLKVFSSVKVQLIYDECSQKEAGLLPDANIENKRNIDLKNWVVNPEDYTQWSTKSKSNNIVKKQVNLGEYCIITPEKLVGFFDNLVLWKKQKGYNVTVKSVESIISNPQFKPTGQPEREDSASSIRAYIKSLYDKSENGYVYCLLAGHVDDGMPIRRVKSTRMMNDYKDSDYQNNIKGECYIPSDSYFCDVLTSWNLEKEPQTGIFTAVDKDIDLSPIIYVGRLMCRTEEEINNYIEKLIIYESNPGLGNNNYLDKLVLFSQYDLRFQYSKFLENVNCFSEEKLMLDSYISDKNARGPKGSEVITEISSSGFSSWMGHGNPASVLTSGPSTKGSETWKNLGITALDAYGYEDSWITPQESGNGLDNLTNINKPSVAYSISCDITPFDRLEGESGNYYDIKYNMGESYTIGGIYGGVALFGNTRVGFISQSSYLQNEFGTLLSDFGKAGILENESKEKLLRKYNSNETYHVVHANNLIGDPEFEIWRGKPTDYQLDVDFKSGNVKVSGNTLHGSMISIYDGKSLNSLVFSDSDNVLISYAPKNLDMGLCSVWKEGVLPCIKFFGNNGSLMSKGEFITNEAYLGLSDNFTISADGILKIIAINQIYCGSGLIISNGGQCILKSMKNIDLTGCVVEKDGVMKMDCDTVKLGPGFSVEKGGCLFVNM